MDNENAPEQPVPEDQLVDDEIAETHDEDVEECLKRETDDGSGLENDDESQLPEADFEKSMEDLA